MKIFHWLLLFFLAGLAAAAAVLFVIFGAIPNVNVLYIVALILAVLALALVINLTVRRYIFFIRERYLTWSSLATLVFGVPGLVISSNPLIDLPLLFLTVLSFILMAFFAIKVFKRLVDCGG